MTQDILIEEKTPTLSSVFKNENNYFPNFIGQERIKNQLSFLLDTHKKTKIFHPILLASTRGSGKSQISREIGKNLLDFKNQSPRKFLEINSASVKTVSGLVNDIIIPHVQGNQEVTVFFDEFGQIDSKVSNWLLSILCPNDNNITSAYHDGIKYEFDYKYVSFITATTDAFLLSLPMKSRLRRLEFQPYTYNDLITILKLKTPNVEYQEEVESEIAPVLRDSPRSTVMLAGDISQYMANKYDRTFNRNDWNKFKNTLDILPMGLTRNELQLLKFLKAGDSSLTCLAAKFNLTTPELRREIELYPMAKGLMTIESKRRLTGQGASLLKEMGL